MYRLRALTLHQPWASLIAEGHKMYETRSWPAPFDAVGHDIIIHAGKRVDRSFANSPLATQLLGGTYRLPVGAAVAIARLDAVERTERARMWLSDTEQRLGDFSAGRFAWKLVYVRRLRKPIPMRGLQGLWPVPDELAEAVRAAPFDLAA